MTLFVATVIFFLCFGKSRVIIALYERVCEIAENRKKFA